jgi:hypothetical protein
MQPYTVLLPTKAYLCRYVLTLYGQGTETVMIDPSTSFGDLIITKMASTLNCNLKPADYTAAISKMSTALSLQLPAQWFRKLPLQGARPYDATIKLTPHQVIRINRHLQNDFEQDLCDIVARAHNFMGIERQVAIECFAHNHGIRLEEDISFEALKKMEYRYRSENARHTVRKKIVQELSSMLKAA